MIISGTPLEKTARFVFGVFMLCAVILPLGSAVSSFGEFVPDTAAPGELASDADGLERSVIEQRLAGLAEEKLSENGIEDADCEVSLVCEDGEIKRILCSVSLTDDDRESYEKVEQILSGELGMDVI